MGKVKAKHWDVLVSKTTNYSATLIKFRLCLLFKLHDLEVKSLVCQGDSNK